MKRLTAVVMLCMLVLGCRVISFRVEQTRTLMGTDVEIIAFHEDENTGRVAVRRAFNTIQDVEGIMSGFVDNSQVFRLNTAGMVKRPHEYFTEVINKSMYYSELSGGAFDITVQPVLELYRATANLNRTPTEEELSEALSKVDYRKLTEENGSFYLPINMSITLGGIAKGYAVDKAIEALQVRGIERALVNAGGDMRAIGVKELEQPWTIALKNPRNASEFITVIRLEDMAVATSGDYERYYFNKSYHHIIDPKTGRSATGLISVTVVAPTATEADALSTTVFVMGKDKGLELVESIQGVEALIITSEKEIVRSSGFSW
jgi:thiamine biosynthesis lipoprotein